MAYVHEKTESILTEKAELSKIAHSLKKQAIYRMDLGIKAEGDRLDDLYESKTLLEQVLKLDPGDHDAIFYMGLVHYYLLLIGPFGDSYKHHAVAAFEFFERVNDQFYQPPGGHNLQSLMENLSVLFPLEPPSSENYSDDDLKYFGFEVSNKLMLMRNIECARANKSKTPIHLSLTLKDCGHALIYLSIYHSPNKRKEMVEEAVEKLKHSYSINPVKQTKLHWLNALMEITDDEDEKNDLYKEYYSLTKD